MSKPPTPSRPPPSKLSDLRIYSSPHCEYKEFIKNDHITCKGHETQLTHAYLLPIVKRNRIAVFDFCNYCTTEAKKCIDNVTNFVKDKKKKLFYQARHPDNYQIRRGVIATGAVLSFMYGMRKGRYKDSILKGTLCSTLTSLATGYMCFPETTDVCFRNTVYYGATAGLAMYNIYASDNKKLTVPLSCNDTSPKSPGIPQKKEVKRFPGC